MTDQTGKAPKHFVVFVPGYMGSQLASKKTGQLVWIDIRSLLRDPFNLKEAVEELFTTMMYPNDDLVPAGIVKDVLFLPPLFKQEQYGRMLDALKKFGYAIDPTDSDPDQLSVYTFDYDWRQDNRLSGQQLGQRVAELRAKHDGAKAWLIGHSNGGIVSRWYIEKEGGKEHVGRLFLMGSPWDGAPKSVKVMQEGLEMMFTRLLNRFGLPALTRNLVLSFPSYYQLIPAHNPFLRDKDNNVVDPFADPSWLAKKKHRELLLDARKFNQELGVTASVDELCFFGVRLPTTTAGIVTKDAAGRYKKIDWLSTEAGDGTVPERSAVHPNAREKLPYSVGHGDIYVDPAVLEKLEWEMVKKYRSKVLAKVLTENYFVQFEPVKDAYEPGEAIQMWAVVRNRKTNSPVLNAEIDVQLQWVQSILGIETGIETKREGPQPFASLAPNRKKPGRYEGVLIAPVEPAYYRLLATVRVEGEKPIILEELVLVEPQDEAGQEALLQALAEQSQAREMTSAFLPEPDAGGEPTHGLAGGLMGAFPDASVAFATPGAPGAASDQPEAARVLNASIEGHNNQEALQMGQEYTLAFSVDLEQLPWSMGIGFDDQRLFQAGESMVELTVQISSKDFKTWTNEPQKLRVPRTGKSRNKARFDIEPRHEGPGEITALFFRNNNFVQGMTIQTWTGPGADQALLAVESMGRAPDGAFSLQPRDVSLFIRDTGAAYECTMVGAVAAQAVLPVKDPALASRIAALRQALLDIVMHEHEGEFPYQNGIDIPEAANAAALEKLAKAGWLLFNDLFGVQAGADAQLMGQKLRELADKGMLRLQIVSKEFSLPWSALYVARRFEAGKIKADNFLGLKHIIEQIPYQPNMPVLDRTIVSSPNLSVGLNLNDSIDEQFDVTVVKEQRDYWDALAQKYDINKVVRTTSQEFIDALNDPEMPDQIMYFYGHAVARLDNPGGSSFDFGDGRELTKDDLALEADPEIVLAGAPLVFINACESAQQAPQFYDGFMPYFVAKGARGMIGTECKVPAIFAAEWARRFFDAFLAGEKNLGQVFLSLRREFYEEHNNVLGLLYSMYCDGDTIVEPGLT